jgi:hypothetical protein
MLAFRFTASVGIVHNHVPLHQCGSRAFLPVAPSSLKRTTTECERLTTVAFQISPLVLRHLKSLLPTDQRTPYSRMATMSSRICPSRPQDDVFRANLGEEKINTWTYTTRPIAVEPSSRLPQTHILRHGPKRNACWRRKPCARRQHAMPRSTARTQISDALSKSDWPFVRMRKLQQSLGGETGPVGHCYCG